LNPDIDLYQSEAVELELPEFEPVQYFLSAVLPEAFDQPTSETKHLSDPEVPVSADPLQLVEPFELAVQGLVDPSEAFLGMPLDLLRDLLTHSPIELSTGVLLPSPFQFISEGVGNSEKILLSILNRNSLHLWFGYGSTHRWIHR
jgi:hypothetical protein